VETAWCFVPRIALLFAALSYASSAGQFNVGDIFLEPVWLQWTGKHYDINYGYGFYIPAGKYEIVYPWPDRRMAIEKVITWEINQQKRATDLIPGQHLTWNWGISQYLPLKKDPSILAEIGPAGYLSYQVTDNSGTAAMNATVHDHVNAAGIQIGVTLPKQMIALNFSTFHEYSAVDQFQGNEYGLNLSERLKAFKQYFMRVTANAGVGSVLKVREAG